MAGRMRKGVGLGITLVVVAISATFLVAQGYWQWTSEIVDTATRWNFWGNTLAFSPADNEPAIAFYDYNGGKTPLLKFVARTNGVWGKPVVVDPKTGDPTLSLAFDPVTKYPAIAYGGNCLRLVRWNGSAWGAPQVIDPSPAPNRGVRLVYDAGGHPSIAYCVKVGNKGLKGTIALRYARFDGASWKIDTIATGVNYDFSLALDPDGNPGIAYATGWAGASMQQNPVSTLWYAWKDPAGSTGWNTHDIDTQAGAGGNPSIGFDASGAPAIVDTAGPVYSYETLRFWTRDNDGFWSFRPIVNPPEVVADPQVKFSGPLERWLVIYQYGPNYHAVMITRLLADGTTEGSEPVVASSDRVDSYDYASFALDRDGLPAVAYRHHPWNPEDPYHYYLRFSQPR